ncbi:chloride channel protein [Wenyingzhuangia sp. 2_MG-2023]|uniref:chloride channel protein n=1 Tax=Wenyingzhuangia sp. 2_MG-2023 TaxID=3062639 RepID=UPI0026E1436D|nr:chloride channel protein [Wenyingzhuangia sp. 2_MG-2023]MDO6736526.1 chloride channel protein [Wenyingzhuangia sp. 2_MG-2023]MDO6801179.1 chloride channel protein [Wenyingzhuangia sp. 1_MG-2023]
MPKKKNILNQFLIWKYKHISPENFLYILSVVVGFLAGIGAVTLKNLTHFIFVSLETGFIKEIHIGFYFIFPIIGLSLTLLVIKFIIRKKIGHGIPSTLYAISKRESIMYRYQMWASILTAPLTVGFGGSVGLEGPTVATGSALGSNFARLFHLDQRSRTLLVGCAAAGAMSSIFKAPIAAIVFAVEIFSLELTMISMIPLLLASISAVITSYLFLGDEVLLHFEIKDSFELNDIGFYILLGVGCSLISIYFTKVYFWVHDFFKKIENPWYKLLLGGSLIGVIVFFIPPLFGEGFETINAVLRGDASHILKNNIFNTNADTIWMVVGLLIGLIIFKVIAMALTFGAGGIGGVFAPTLFIGSVTGYVVATIVNQFKMVSHTVSSSNFAMVGMAGLMAGVLHAPLTAIFLIAEITGGYELFVPLMIVSSISFLVTKKFIPFNIYTAELAKKGQLMTHDKDKNVLMMMDIDKVVETDFILTNPKMTLGQLVHKAIVKSKRNNFPVVNKHKELVGVLHMDDIRPIMFNTELYETTFVSDLMTTPLDVINYDQDSMEVIMDKFKITSAWNLPIIKDGKYHGFISKSRLLNAYRRKLIMASDSIS